MTSEPAAPEAGDQLQPPISSKSTAASTPAPTPAPTAAPQPAAQQPQPQPAPASSPLPSRHTATTPGPRAARFQELLNGALSSTLKKLAWDNFAACYPTIASSAPATLKAVQKQMVERLGALCRKEFDSILANRNVVAKLNELEGLVSEAGRRRDEGGFVGEEREVPVPPHMLSAEDVLAAHLAPHLATQQSQLNARLQTMQAHNSKLFADIQGQRAEMASLMALLEKLFEDIDGANQMMDGVMDDVAKETRTVELEMSGT
ncbi:Nnf1-domain-containing protein [Pseudomassariella vexata]|uniref:Nnf1-domain-containing protein n=1 Tax=Pseudomassariella vexata TaxID=1141098 RepID=A0A1Y2EF47_9PEZI|nr:Nnf1-domain-containing protein [Pseudomassariella vexata]ORY69896.1 Nnf1-domain-containing protein [Pseudomassariella vexata]